MRWRYGVLVGIFLALLSLYPQAALIYHRGSEYNGATFVNDNDESEYIAYLQAIIDGRPRKNNIYSGGTEEPSETFLSIQALPAYAAAIPAKLIGLSAEKTFPLLSVLCAFAAVISLFWFLSKVTENSAFAATAAFAVLVMGVTVAGYGVLKYFLGLGPASASLPFLRRYTPGLAFPFVFMLFGSAWLALKSSQSRERLVYALLASVSFGALIYSYFYLWTAALAWVIILAFLSVALDADNRQDLILKLWIPFFAFSAIISFPYFVLLSRRSESTDDAQALELTRQIVLSRPSIWVSALIILAIVWLVRSRRIELNHPLTFFIISFALLPIIVFNQQIITGYSLQPFHYNLYIAPYVVLISLALLVWELLKDKLSELRPVVWVGLILTIGVWGAIEAHYTTLYRLHGNMRRDAAMPVSQRLAEIGYRDFDAAIRKITFNADSLQADNQPATAPQGVLWSEHLPWASSLSSEDARRRYYLHLYYLNKDESYLRESLVNCPEGPDCKALFGWRVIPTLSIKGQPPSPEEVEEVIGEFSAFLENFSPSDAFNPMLSYAIIPAIEGFDFTNIEKWYERDASEVHGKFVLYRLKPSVGIP